MPPAIMPLDLRRRPLPTPSRASSLPLRCGLTRARALLTLLLCLTLAGAAAAQNYTSIVVFGDSLCDTGNDALLTSSMFTVNAQLPGPATGYTNGRFTDGLDTSPAARLYTGVWVEQLAAKLAAKPPVVASLSGGTNYAYGGATTATGSTSFSYGPANAFTFQAANMGQQLTTYLATNPVITPQTLFVVWGGANDLLNATSTAAIGAAAQNELGIVQTLVSAGASNILLVNLPPLGLIPRLNGSATAAATATAAAQGFDAALAQGYAQLVTGYAGKVNLRLLDVYTLFNTIVGPPIAQGFANVTSSSQGVTTVNPDTYLFWDGLHPTTFGHSLLAAAALIDLGTPVATTTAVTSANSNTNLNAAVALTASVTGTAGTPVGTVTFYDGTTAIGSALLHGPATGTSTTATASISTSTLIAGTHSITANFAGVNGYVSSVSPATSQVVVAPSYTAALATTSVTVARGASTSVNLTVTPSGGLTGTFTLTCGPVPTHAACGFGQSTLTVSSATSVSTTLTLSTAAVSALLRPGLLPRGMNSHDMGTHSGLPGRVPTEWALLGVPVLGGLALARRRGRRSLRTLGLTSLLLLACAAASAGLSGCSSGATADPYANDLPTGTYSIPVLVTPPSGQAATTLTLNVTVQ